jgi:hypothetical protein
MHRPAMMLLLLVGCAARAGLPAGDTGPVKAPAWETRDATRPLWPDGTRTIQVIVSPSSESGQLYAVGISDGKKVVWAFRLQAASLGALFEASRRDLPTTANHEDDLIGWTTSGGAGSTEKPPPPPIGPGGDLIPAAFLHKILTGADRIRMDTEALRDQLAH